MSYVIQIHTFQLTEILISGCLNIDVILTLKHPFDRSNNLKKILVGMKIGIACILMFSMGCVFYILYLCNPDNNTYNIDNGNSDPYESWN